jgi:hypothetical protein
VNLKVASVRFGLLAGAASAGCFAVLLLFEAIGVDRAAPSYVNVWIASFAAALIALALGFTAFGWRVTRRRAGLALLLAAPILLVLAYMTYAASTMDFDNSF